MLVILSTYGCCYCCVVYLVCVLSYMLYTCEHISYLCKLPMYSLLCICDYSHYVLGLILMLSKGEKYDPHIQGELSMNKTALSQVFQSSKRGSM